MRVYLLSLLIVLLSVEGSVSQNITRSCGTHVLYPPSLQKGYIRPQYFGYKQLLETFSFPVIIHILHDGEAIGVGRNISTEQILSQLDVLNEDFNRLEGSPGFNNSPVGASLNITFIPSLQDTCQNELAEAGVDRINRKDKGFLPPPYARSYLEEVILPATIWDPNKYLNIWVCEIANNLQGIAQFPDSSGLPGIPVINGAPDRDGIIVDYQSFGRVGNVLAPFDRGRTATHELGHWLGLIHTWGDGGCSEDDFCQDTPFSDAPTSGCPSDKQSCGSVDMVENYMDFSDDACMNIFTQDQQARVWQVLTNSPRRRILADSPVGLPVSISPTANFLSSATDVCPGSFVFFTDQSKGSPQSWLWTFEGGTPSESADQNPIITYQAGGTYSVTLRVENELGISEIVREEWITVRPDLNEAVVFSEDFEEGLSNWEIENPDGGLSWEPSFVMGSRAGTAAATLRHYDYLARGERDRLISPSIDLTQQESPILRVDYAYQSFGPDRQDSLYIYIMEENRGKLTLLTVLGEDGNGSYATTEESRLAFFPTSSQEWCYESGFSSGCVEVDLSSFAGKGKVKLIFETVNDFGNNLYLDNIRVLGNCVSVVTSLASLHKHNRRHIYPNPCQGDCWISPPFDLDSSFQLEVFDSQLNKLVEQHFSPPFQENIPLSFPTLSPGIYLLIFHSGGNTYTEKLLIY